MLDGTRCSCFGESLAQLGAELFGVALPGRLVGLLASAQHVRAAGAGLVDPVVRYDGWGEVGEVTEALAAGQFVAYVGCRVAQEPGNTPGEQFGSEALPGPSG
ncbi:hypothetical protein [Streptomyces umbrinus]|uniref:hypothetical protein n=1 Tax=Streptomyces umbrinus TaxID=67370 RepID=UPI0033C51341